MEINFDTYKPRAVNRYTKLSLDKDEQVRVSFLTQSPQLVYVHNFEKVVVDDQGNPIEIDDKWPDGTPNRRAKTTWAGKLRCLGQGEVVQSTGADPDNCPACRAHIETSAAVKAPVARIIGQVLKYKTKPGSFTPSKPFGAELVIWDLTTKRFSQLMSIYEEHGDLSGKDLLLGPCENQTMQTYTIAAGNGVAHWRQDENDQRYVMELLAEGKVDDLADAAGKLPSEFEMETKVNEIVRAYNHAFGKGTSSYSSLLSSDNVDSIAKQADVPAPTPAPAPVVEQVKEEEPVAADTTVETEAPKTVEATTSLEDMLRSFQG